MDGLQNSLWLYFTTEIKIQISNSWELIKMTTISCVVQHTVLAFRPCYVFPNFKCFPSTAHWVNCFQPTLRNCIKTAKAIIRQ